MHMQFLSDYLFLMVRYSLEAVLYSSLCGQDVDIVIDVLIMSCTS